MPRPYVQEAIIAQAARNETSVRVGEDVYRIRLNNAGRIAAERFMSGGSQELKRQLATLTPSDEALAALLWGGTRKYHANDIRDEQDLYEVLDEAEEYFEDQNDDYESYNEYFAVPLISGYTRITERNLNAMMKGEDPPDPMPGGNRAARRSKKNGSSEKGKKGPTKVESQEAEAS